MRRLPPAVKPREALNRLQSFAKARMEGRVKGSVRYALVAWAALAAGCGAAAEPIRVVGSSTVYPFAALAAETYSRQTGVPMVVEQTGSGGGHKLFCAPGSRVDVTTSSRAKKPSEIADCEANGRGDALEFAIGRDGVVLAQARDDAAPDMSLELTDIYRALAKTVPDGAAGCRAVPNPHRLWSDVSDGLPAVPITVHGPPPTSGTRDAFAEMVMEAGARRIPCLAALEASDGAAFQRRAQTLREDGAWIDAGENDAALVQTLTQAPDHLGVFGYAVLDQNRRLLQGVSLQSVTPDREAITTGRYPVSRTLYLYIDADAGPAVRDYVAELLSDAAAGEDGYLERAGLLTLTPDERAVMRSRLRTDGAS